MDAVEDLIEPTDVIDIQIALLLLLIGREDVRDRRVAVPLEVSDIRVLCHQLVNDGEHIVLYLGVGEVEDELVAIVICLAVRLFDDPVMMLLIELTLRVHHLRLNPQTELHAGVLRGLYEGGDATGEFRVCRLPVAETGMVVLTGILVAEPSVVEEEHLHAEVLGILHQLGQRLLVEVEACVLPVVEECHACTLAIPQLVFAGPVVEVSGGRRRTVVAHREDELGSFEGLTSLEDIVGGIRIDAWDDAQAVDVVDLEGAAEVTRPVDGAEHHRSLVLTGGSVDAELEERLTLFGGARAELRVDDLLAELELLGRGLSLTCPVAVVVGQIILAGVEIEDATGITPQRDRFLLVMLDLTPGLDDVLLLISYIVERHFVGILVVSETDNRLRTTVDSLLLRVLII